MMSRRSLLRLSTPFALFLLFSASGTQADNELAAKVDQIFAQWNRSSPGCTVAASSDGKKTLAKAYGMADLEHEIPNTPDTIFEAGSVSKQFTAAAVLLLAQDGKLSLDDSIRKFLPELPAYTAPITIRHILTHTSGLRDWGNIVAVAGWPRSSRVHTHAHVLDVLARQRSLNFEPGTRWSYSNSGYNLAAIIVDRVSGMSLAEFTKTRIFEPLGMTRTSWRDDYTRVVKNRAIAYSRAADGFHTNMPFENVYGNGGLLTTVGDLLRWNQNFVTPKVGGAEFVRLQLEKGRLRDGRPHNYAMGLGIESYNGLPVVQHAGATAGYAAMLLRFPEQRLSVAVLCNAAMADAPAPRYAAAVADLYLKGALSSSDSKAKHTLTRDEIAAVRGLYRNVETSVPLRIIEEKGGMRLRNGPQLKPTSGTVFTYASSKLELTSPGHVRVTDAFGSDDRFERVDRATPTPSELAQFSGTYVSDEAETTFTVAVEGTSLVLHRRPDATLELAPIYADVFDGPMGTIIFRRDSSGRPVALSVVDDRVWDLRFERQRP